LPGFIGSFTVTGIYIGCARTAVPEEQHFSLRLYRDEITAIGAPGNREPKIGGDCINFVFPAHGLQFRAKKAVRSAVLCVNQNAASSVTF